VHVQGVGGIFLRARDPKALGTWYRERFGLVDGGPTMTLAGPLVFSAFPHDTDYFGGPQAFMLNLRVDDLDGLLAKLAAAGVPEVKPREAMAGIGAFGWVEDPEGNRIELWQPEPGASLSA
jgi:predicted enzyme related to lactoylglutathione lyase